ncbi:MAG: UDP-N-acetylmuramoyl-tripeptide--D-alanyl-D-alanine ligase [Bacillota bacterium]
MLYVIKRLRRELLMFQLNSYRNQRFGHWLKEQGGRILLKRDLIPVILLLISCLFSSTLITMPLLVIVYAVLFFSYQLPPEKKPLVMTKRAFRLYLVSIIIVLVLGIIFVVFAVLSASYLWLILAACIVSPWPFLPMLLANLILLPFEKAINKAFLNDAKKIIRSLPFLTTIAITGSYGKTSCKMILGEILTEQFMTLVTPASFNTPMGLTRVIRESLRPTHEMFVAEMGAKQAGDIQELCDLVRPKVGILTAIGPQHLETFGSLDNIINTKFELIKNIPADGFAVLNFDDEEIKKRAANFKCRQISYGLDPQWDYYADEITYNARGSSFTVHAPKGQSLSFTTLLLGRHNIYNIVAAVAAAHQLGLSLEKAAKAVQKLLPIQHRLQFIPNPQGFNVIDDAFNSNPQGAAAALEVLACFTEGQKIIVTPGMVELGEQQYQLNKAFAQQAAKVCDYIILVGKNHSQPLQDGLAAAAYPVDQYYVAADLTDARLQLAKIAQVGDVVLFENDLPDTYNE